MRIKCHNFKGIVKECPRRELKHNGCEYDNLRERIEYVMTEKWKKVSGIFYLEAAVIEFMYDIGSFM